MLTFAYALLTTIIHLAGAYLRYLPFSQILDQRRTTNLWKALLFWSIAGFIINVLVTSVYGISMLTFKLLFFFGMTPYFILSIIFIPRHLSQHFFVIGIQALYSFMLHSVASIILTIVYSTMTAKLLPLQLTLWLILFLLIYPWGEKLFITLLPDEQFVSDSKLRWYIALLPVSFYIGCIISITNLTFLPELSDRLTRLSIPLFFFIIYSLVHYNSREAVQHRQLIQTQKRLTRQLQNLKEHTRIVQENEKAISVLRHDLRHSYRLIYALLEKRDYESIKKHIESQKKLLENK